ncbi:ERV/ALR sulfhydryl oxidase domain-containing protein, partial [Sphaerosporella brunnea]
ECLPDVERLKRSSWTLLHTITTAYPTEPMPTQQEEMKTFMRMFSKINPCWCCVEDFRAWMSRPENNVSKYVQRRKTFGKWLCDAHNDVVENIGGGSDACVLRISI